MPRYQFREKFFSFYTFYLILGLLGLFLLSRFWLPPGFVLAGHDSGLPIDAKQFLTSRLFAWDDRVGFGLDNSHLFGSLTLHFVDYLSSLITGGAAGNWLNLFFWLSLIFISAFIFAYQLRNTLGKYFVFLFPPLIIFNFYIFQSIFILERAKYSILIAILLFLAILFRLESGKISLLLAAILSSLVFFIFNGGSLLALPLYGSLFVIVAVILVFYLILGIKASNFRNFFRLLSFLFLTGVLTLLLSSYHILPYVPGILGQIYLLHLSSAVLERSIDWVRYISQSSSLLNIFRLQGVPSWYSGSFTIEPNHPYAKEYASNILLVIASFLFPIIAFASLLLARLKEQKKILLLFAFIALVSMVFVAGTHRPLGFLYGLLYENLPGFEIFRTPYYKFASAFFLSISVLIAFSASVFVERASSRLSGISWKRDVVGVMLSLILIGLWLSYHYVLFEPDKILSWQKGSSTRVKIPEYVQEFSEWTKLQKENEERVLLVPPLSRVDFIDSYEWGYWSLSPVTHVLTSKPTLINELGLTPEERAWVSRLYALIGENKEDEFLDLASRLGVGFILLRKDMLGAESPQLFEDALNQFSKVDKIESFGQWIFYKINRQPTPKISAVPLIALTPSDASYLSREFLENEHGAFVKPEVRDRLEPFYSREVTRLACQSCLLEEREILTSLPDVAILPNSPLYYFKTQRERATLKNTQTTEAKIDAYLGFILRRTAEIKIMLDGGVEDRYIISSLKTMNNYLDEIYSLSSSNREKELNFFRIKQLLNILNLTGERLRVYFGNEQFNKRSEDLRREVEGILWGNYKVRKLANSMIGDIDLKSQKIYDLDFPEAGEYQLFLNIDSLPSDVSGNVSKPTTATISRSEEKLDLGLTEGVDGWLEIKLPFQEEGMATLELHFEDVPNLFKPEGTSQELLKTGPRGCYRGAIHSFRSDRAYRIETSSSEKEQTIKLYLTDGDSELSRDGFFRPFDTVDVYPIKISEPFVYTYYPSSPPRKDVKLFLCSDDEDLPIDINVSVYEISSPQVLLVKPYTTDIISGATVSSKKVNPTKYLISVNDSAGPFTILFNERYNPLWELEGSEGHFVVDGYANGWLIDKRGDFDLVLEYTPQQLFRTGSLVTVASLALLSGIALWITLVKRKT